MKALPLFILLASPQTPSAPPSPHVATKMGLWELSTTISHSGATTPGPGSRTLKQRVCITPQTVPPQLLGQASNLCTPSNVHKQGTHTVMDLTCPNMTSHVDTEVLSPELTRIFVHTNITYQGKTSVADSVMESRFVSSSCGTVQPGQPITMQ